MVWPAYLLKGLDGYQRVFFNFHSMVVKPRFSISNVGLSWLFDLVYHLPGSSISLRSKLSMTALNKEGHRFANLSLFFSDYTLGYWSPNQSTRGCGLSRHKLASSKRKLNLCFTWAGLYTTIRVQTNALTLFWRLHFIKNSPSEISMISKLVAYLSQAEYRTIFYEGEGSANIGPNHQMYG